MFANNDCLPLLLYLCCCRGGWNNCGCFDNCWNNCGWLGNCGWGNGCGWDCCYPGYNRCRICGCLIPPGYGYGGSRGWSGLWRGGCGC